MKKIVTLELIAEEEHLSEIYGSVATVVAFIEDEAFEVTNVKIDDIPKASLAAVPRTGGSYVSPNRSGDF